MDPGLYVQGRTSRHLVENPAGEENWVPAVKLGMLKDEPMVLEHGIGESHSDAGRAEEAATTFKKAEDVLEESTRRNPLSSSAHLYLGATRYKMGSYDEAETSLKRGSGTGEEVFNAVCGLMASGCRTIMLSR